MPFESIEARREYMRNWYHTKYKEKRRNKDPRVALADKKNYERQKEKYPEKVKARYTLRQAVRRGKISKKPCEVCGEIKVQAHHENHLKPLEVMWLCLKHHREADKMVTYRLSS